MEREWELAIQSGDSALISKLIERGADINSEVINSKDRHGQTALMLASVRGHPAVVRLLVENGAALNHTAKYNLSALMLAVINGNADIVQILVDAGADLQIQGTGAPGFSGFTALQLAERAGQDQIAALLRNADRSLR
jgi:ankyrin repeat protein